MTHPLYTADITRTGRMCYYSRKEEEEEGEEEKEEQEEQEQEEGDEQEEEERKKWTGREVSSDLKDPHRDILI